MTFKLQVKDMKILRELDFHARQPISQIAKKIGLSPEVTAYRIKQLENKGIITGYYPVIDLAKLGYMFCRFRFQFVKMDKGIKQELFQYAKSESDIGWLNESDNSRITFVVYAKTIVEAKEIYEKIYKKFYGIIKNSSFSIATKIYHLKRKYLYDQNDDSCLLYGDNKTVSLDTIDFMILQELTKDVRSTSVMIAEKVGLTSMAVINRIKRMENEKLILGYRCSLDIAKLGYIHVKVFLSLIPLSTEKKSMLLQSIKQWRYSVYITESIGQGDLEFECHVPSIHLFDQFISSLQCTFPEIRSYENWLHYKENIIKYLPSSEK